MATAINFNWIIPEKLTDGKTYNFTFTQEGSTTAHELTLMKIGRTVTISDSAGGEKRVDIFRNGMRVKDAIAIGIQRAGRVTSGEVYKADILREVSAEYETNEIYSGINCPSHEYATNKPRKDSAYFVGFELETGARNADCTRALHALSSNIWRQVTDGSIRGINGGDGIEFVSTLIHPDDAVKPAFFEAFLDTITGLAVSGSLSCCGLHCHISREAFGDDDATQDENIAKFIYLENYLLKESSLETLYGRDACDDWARPNRGRAGIIEHINALAQYDRTIINNNGIKNALTADLMIGNKCRTGHNYPSERYHRVNITNAHTVELRQGKGQIKSQALANIAQHALTAAKYCRETRWANLSAAGYWRSIPTSAKYGEIKRIFALNEDND